MTQLQSRPVNTRIGHQLDDPTALIRDTESVLGESLYTVRRRLMRAQCQAAFVQGFERVLPVVFIATTGYVVVCVVDRWSPSVAAWGGAWLGISTLIASAVWFYPVMFTIFAPTSVRETAERLDLATGGHNRVATALDLARQSILSECDYAAIDDGIRQLLRVKDKMPFLSPRPLRVGRDVLLLALTIMLLLSTRLVSRRDQSRIVLLEPVLPGEASVVPRADIKSIRQTDKPQIPAATAAVAMTAASASGPSGANSAAPVSAKATAPAAASAAADKENAAMAMAAPDDAATPQPAGERDHSPGTDTSSPSTGKPAHTQAMHINAPTPAPTPTPSDVGASGAARSAAASGAGATPKSPAARSGHKKPTDAPNGGGAAGTSAPPADAPPPDPSTAGDGDGASVQTEQPLPNSGGFSSTPSTGADSKGSGRTVGEGAPKKSRGVAPLMLGVRQPDLFQGRRLPGPDERTKLLLPSERDPGPPAPAAEAAARTTDERPADRYAVPGDLRGAVGTYFQKFHADANPPDAKPTAGPDAKPDAEPAVPGPKAE